MSLIIIGAYPMCFWLGWLAFACRVALYLGRWPRFDRPDPKNLPKAIAADAESFGGAAWVLGFLAFVSVFGWIASRPPRPARRLYVGVIVAVMGWMGMYIVAKIDPGGIIEWIID